jgi:predicted transposase/invertase (TIGR01784 family)
VRLRNPGSYQDRQTRVSRQGAKIAKAKLTKAKLTKAKLTKDRTKRGKVCGIIGLAKVHHAFRLVDQDSGRLLGETLEIHTLELGWYNLQESELGTASLLDRWLYWLLHAHQYDAQTLGSLFSQPEFQKATDSIDRIAKKTEDKAMYDTREKAIRDQQWILNAARREGLEEGEIKGREEGEIKLIQTLQEILGGPVSDAAVFQDRSLEQLRAMTEELRKKIQRRT